MMTQTTTQMDQKPLTIDWQELAAPAVDARLAQLGTVKATLNHYDSTSEVVSAVATKRASVIYNAAFFLGLFGLLGGLLGWGIGEILHFRPDAQAEARTVIADYEELMAQKQRGEVGAVVARQAIDAIVREYKANPYFAAYVDPALSKAQKQERFTKLIQEDAWKAFLTNTLFFGFSGLMIAVCLAMAEPLVERNITRATINGAIGAVLGLLGGVAVSLMTREIHARILGGVDDSPTRGQQILAHMIDWGVLGIFLAAAPGVLLGSMKRMGIGVIGGLVGGLLGGLLFVPLAERFSEHVSRLGGMLAIGTIIGISCGLLETAVRTGWMKVVKGLIAGKQFVLYRNPTYIGAHPSCHIYLFKDQQVGKRHAALHVTNGGVEIEDLPLGGPTLVNGKAVRRARLRGGDRVQIGKTIFQFFEKRPQAV